MATALATQSTAYDQKNKTDIDALHREYLKTQDQVLCAELIEHYKYLALSLGRRMARRSREREDVTQVAMLGLLKAVNRFDPDRGVSFGTFAWRTIEGEVKRYFRDSSWSMHVPRSLQERSVMVAGAVDELAHELGRSPTMSDIGKRLGLTEDEVVEVFELQRACRSVSLDGQEDDDESGTPLQVGEEDIEYERADERHVMHDLIRTLPPREQIVVRLRFVDQLTQTEIADRIGVSQMHVSRLLTRSLARLREQSDTTF